MSLKTLPIFHLSIQISETQIYADQLIIMIIKFILLWTNNKHLSVIWNLNFNNWNFYGWINEKDFLIAVQNWRIQFRA